MFFCVLYIKRKTSLISELQTYFYLQKGGHQKKFGNHYALQMHYL